MAAHSVHIIWQLLLKSSTMCVQIDRCVMYVFDMHTYRHAYIEQKMALTLIYGCNYGNVYQDVKIECHLMSINISERNVNMDTVVRI